MPGLLSWLLGMFMLEVMCIAIVWCLWYFFGTDSPRHPPQDRNYWSDAALRTWATMYVGNNQKLRRDYNQTSAQGVVAKSKKSPKKSPKKSTTASTYTAASVTAPSMDDLIRLSKAAGNRNTRLR
jgi:hypothetical protein